MKPTLLIVPLLLGAALLWWLTWGTEPQAPREPPAPPEAHEDPVAIAPPRRKAPPKNDPAIETVAEKDPAPSGVLVLARMERQHAREQARLLAARETIYEQLFANGRVTEAELLLARIDHAVVRATAADATERKRTLDDLVQHTRRLSTVLGLQLAAGRAAATQTEGRQQALKSLESLREWLDSEMRWDGAEEPPVSPAEPPAGTLPTTREALCTEWERLAAEHLEQELALLGKLARTQDEEQFDIRDWSLRMRRNLALAQLGRWGDLEFEGLKQGIERAESAGDEDAAWRVVRGQMSLYIWYSSRARYETTCR